jgi:hypothetical protein
LHSRILYTHKHFNWWVATGLTAATLLLELWSRLVYVAVRGSMRDTREILNAYRMLWAAMPATMARSRRSHRP